MGLSLSIKKMRECFKRVLLNPIRIRTRESSFSKKKRMSIRLRVHSMMLVGISLLRTILHKEIM
jgi:hypothetical protein